MKKTKLIDNSSFADADRQREMKAVCRFGIGRIQYFSMKIKIKKILGTGLSGGGKKKLYMINF
ncbi:hypothetical protein HYU89_03770 [Candidatus Collierbacteria bacterium]|nr:hypothetical protein [Candidatus Collierbacteria bacterium]